MRLDQADGGPVRTSCRGRVELSLTVILGLVASGCGGSAAPPGPPPKEPPSDTVAIPSPKAGETVTIANAAAGARSELPFSVAAGFVAERVAGPALAAHPMFASFDADGRLYVATSSGQHVTAEARRKEPPDVIRRLEDTDGDGRFDKSVVFADRLTYPQGVLWYNGAVYTASPPSLWRLEDTTGDGLADQRRELVTGFPFTGIADDLHGPTLGPDGRIYWGVGRFPYTIKTPDGPVIRRGTAPLIMRCRPDGGEVEVFSAAMGNPVEVAFSAVGEPFACGTFLAPESQGMGLRDAIIHCVEGGVYAVRDRAVIEEKQTGGVLPPMVQLGIAAGSGIMFDHAGSISGGRPTLLAAMFNLHRVPRFALERDGASFRAREAPFLTSTDPDFHPTDVLQDADGSILVIDTGGWFRDCPTSQIAKQNTQGGIYRIRRSDWSPDDDPRGGRIAWSTIDAKALTALLSDSRHEVRERAIATLASRGADAISAIQELRKTKPTRIARINALWTLARIDGPEARAAVRPALDDLDARVRLVAATVAGLDRDAEALPRLLVRLRSPDLAVRRAAATALGRIGDPRAVPPLLRALRSEPDDFLDHAMIRALILIADVKGTTRGLKDESPRVRRGALIALSQMDSSPLTPEQVIPMLDPSEPELHRAVMHIIAAHPQWADEMTEPLRAMLGEEPADQAHAEALQRTLIAFSNAPEVQTLIAATVEDSTAPEAVRVLLLDTMDKAALGETPRDWRHAIEIALNSPNALVVSEAIAAAKALRLSNFGLRLLQIGRDPSQSDDLRVAAIATALETTGGRLDPELFSYLLTILNHDLAPLIRLEAAKTLGRDALDAAQLDVLLGTIEAAGPLILPRLLPAFANVPDAARGRRLLAALDHAPGLAAVSPQDVLHTFELYPEDVRKQAAALAKRLETPAAGQSERLAKLVPQLARGSARRGRDVFFGTKAACSTCHTILGEGGHVGPDLSRIGEGRTTRDLTEAILYPSASFARGYEPFLVALDDGRVQSGIILRQTADRITLMTGDRVEVHLNREAVEAIEPSRTSLMPQGLEANLTNQQLADLVTFLRSLQ